MKKYLDDRQKTLTYKYGYHAFFILCTEVLLMAIGYDMCIRNGIGQRFLDFGIINWMLFIILIPFGYMRIRGNISGFEKEGSIAILYQAPLFTLILIIIDTNILIKIPLLITLWVSFCIKIYQIYKNKDR